MLNDFTDFSALQQTFHSQSPEMLKMFSIIQKVAVTEFPVLVRGESGSGKELVAQAIHDYSQRRDKPFIAINCAALNANILESELFGHVKGAFTGAIRDHKGVFERAEGGTLFLDEIAEIPLELQAKLLRVLEAGEFNRLGGEKAIKTDVRIVAATHKALREEARLGHFRHDLLYRLRVIPIFIPPLRERKADIPLLTQHILQQHKSREMLITPTLTDAAMQTLMTYDWAGNVRELKNILLYALVMSHGRSVIDVDDLPNDIFNPEVSLYHEQPIPVRAEQAMNKKRVQQALQQYGEHLELAAKALGVSRTTLWRYRKKYHI
ncbi:MAG: sigma-54-dependent Fis family transcriptional regulator [Acinetobacter sp.]|jgi:transcriptional regulator with PAS, ATPase and Fis domain|nr:MAG: sigma-54-dependent Fis family transcriptional regulator [Acinetobacter sp.]